MLYTVLIYGDPAVADRMTETEQAEILQSHRDLQERLKENGTYRGSVRLMPPSTAMTVSANVPEETPLVLDGPFIETKEHFLGIYIVEVETMEAALDIAKTMPQGTAKMEVRPVAWHEFS